MGKVQEYFTSGSPGAVSRSVDEIVISVRNAGEEDIPFGAPVFLAEDGAAGFSADEPRDASAFLGFAVRVADKTPQEYPRGQFGEPPAGAWHPGDVMEVLVRGGIVVKMTAAADPGSRVYLRKSDGRLTPAAGDSGSTVLLDNVRVRGPMDISTGTCEVIVNRRNMI